MKYMCDVRNANLGVSGMFHKKSGGIFNRSDVWEGNFSVKNKVNFMELKRLGFMCGVTVILSTAYHQCIKQ